MFCPGIPGAGKTILTSIVIDNLHRKFDKTDVGVCYVYCNFRRQAEQGITDLLASLLKQLAENQPVLPEGVMDLYTRHKARRTRPSMDEVRQALHSLTVNMSSTRLFIVIDALDECHASNGSRLRFLEAVFQVQATSGANVFATSRNIPEITDMFQKCISLEIYASDHDVRRYLDGHMDRLPSFVRRNRELQEEVKTGIVVAVKGMCVCLPRDLGRVAKLSSGFSSHSSIWTPSSERSRPTLSELLLTIYTAARMHTTTHIGTQ